MLRLALLALLCLAAVAVGQKKGGSYESHEALDNFGRFFMRLRPLFEALEDELEEHATLQEETKGLLCVGDNLFMEKLVAAEQACSDDEMPVETRGAMSRQMRHSSEEHDHDDDCADRLAHKECILEQIGWVDAETEEVNRQVVRLDLEMSEVGEALEDTEEQCWNLAAAITPECIRDIFQGRLDVDEILAMLRDIFPSSPEVTITSSVEKKKEDSRQARRRRRKNNKRKGKKRGKKSGPVELSDDEVETLLDIVQDLAYFGCLHTSYEIACADLADDVVRAFIAERDAPEDAAGEFNAIGG